MRVRRALLSGLIPSGTTPAAAVQSLPNVVIVVTDDQPKGTMDALPTVRSEILDRGLHLERGVIPTSLCCPSRASLMTGNLSHTTGVYTNTVEQSDEGGWWAFHQNGLLLLTAAERGTTTTTPCTARFLRHITAVTLRTTRPMLWAS